MSHTQYLTTRGTLKLHRFSDGMILERDSARASDLIGRGHAVVHAAVPSIVDQLASMTIKELRALGAQANYTPHVNESPANMRQWLLPRVESGAVLLAAA